MLKRTYEQINDRIRAGEAVVVTAEEVIPMVREKGIEETAAAVDVVTTATFGTMCSSGVFLSLGHTKPRMRMSRIFLNGVEAYAGIAAVDAYLGATQIPDSDPANKAFPGEFNYGGGHVIEDLVAGREVLLDASSYGTDCYPRREIDTVITLDDLNQAVLFNPRNAYQNYNVAVNLSDQTIYTYMGVLKPQLGNANYSTSGQLSPLLKDPYFRTIGIGSRIFLGGGIGYVAWQGTQHCPHITELPNGGSLVEGGTLAVIGDLKQMQPQWLVGASMLGYGVSLAVGIGVPIPILNEEVLYWASRSDEEIYAPVIDYGLAYPTGNAEPLDYVTYAQLKSGTITVDGKKVPSGPMSSYPQAHKIATSLKSWIQQGRFLLTEPVELLPSIGAAQSLTGLPDK